MDLAQKLNVQRSPSSGRLAAPKARDVRAWAIGPGSRPEVCRALKARNTDYPDDAALSALRSLRAHYLGRWPRLSHFAPLALGTASFETGFESPGYYHSSAGTDFLSRLFG